MTKIRVPRIGQRRFDHIPTACFAAAISRSFHASTPRIACFIVPLTNASIKLRSISPDGVTGRRTATSFSTFSPNDERPHANVELLDDCRIDRGSRRTRLERLRDRAEGGEEPLDLSQVVAIVSGVEAQQQRDALLAAFGVDAETRALVRRQAP